MVVKDFNKYQTLSRICDNTFGKGAHVRSGTQSVILKVDSDTSLVAKFIMVVNFGSENQMNHAMPRHKKEALSMIEAALKAVQEEYKEVTGSKISLTPNLDTVLDSVEFISYQTYNPKKTAYYRLSCNVSVK